MLPGKIFFSNPVDNYKCDTLSYNEFAFPITSRPSSNKKKHPIEKTPFFSFSSPNLSSIVYKNNFNESDFIELTKIENHFSFKTTSSTPKKFPICCNLRLNQIFQYEEPKEVFQIEITLCPYTVLRDMKQKEKIQPFEIRKEFSFQYEEDSLSYFELICERANYNTIFGGERMRNNLIFSALQPPMGVQAKTMAKRKRKEKNSQKKMQKIDSCEYFFDQSIENPEDNLYNIVNDNINNVNNDINDDENVKIYLDFFENSIDLWDQLMNDNFKDDVNNDVNNDDDNNVKNENNLNNIDRFESSLNNDFLSFDFRSEVYNDFDCSQFISSDVAEIL